MTTKMFKWLTQPSKNFENWKPPSDCKGTAFASRRFFFERHATHRNGHVVCPTCGYPTLRHRNLYDYCSLCHWEDDGQDDPWADQPSGPNDHTLAQARKNFQDTFCVWSRAEADNISIYDQPRLFSEVAQIQKKKLCELYDGLMKLKSKEEIDRQWRLIESQWEVILENRPISKEGD